MGYCYGRRSKRRLCDEVHLNLGYRLLCRLGLDGSAPDHATLSKVRHGGFREAELFRRVFERVVETCMGAGLVGGEGFAADALVIEADASYALRIGGPVLPPKRANPSTATRPVREYLAALNSARARRKGTARAPGRGARFSQVALPHRPRRSLDVQGLAQGYLVDLRRATMVDVAATPARRTAEVASIPLMIERTRERFGLMPSRLAGDAACGTGLLACDVVRPVCAGAAARTAGLARRSPGSRPRGRARAGAAARQHAGVQALRTRAAHGGDAGRAPEAKPGAQAPAAARPDWGRRRVPARRRRPEPPTARPKPSRAASDERDGPGLSRPQDPKR